MKALDRGEVRGLLLLSFAAGSADAVGYLGLNHVFTANMTGNLVLMGIALGQAKLAAAARSLMVIAVFMLGVGAGVWLDRGIAEKDWPRLASRVFFWEKVLLVAFAVAWGAALHRSHAADLFLLALLACTMGLQSAALQRLRAPGIGTTAVTSTVTSLATGLTAVALDRSSRGGDKASFQASVLVVYALGAAGGGLLTVSAPWLAGALPALATLLVLPREPRSSSP